MKLSKLAMGLTLTTLSMSAIAAGPLYIHDKTMQPYKWNTSKGAIPIWTDGGVLVKNKEGNDVESFTVLKQGSKYNINITLADGTVIPKNTVLDRDYTLLTIERANEITAAAVAEWSNVETSTLEMSIAGTIESKTGISDLTASNVDQVYGVENGYGFWVVYDTDGSVVEDVFGVPKESILGMAFPEWADEKTGEIIEATAIMNGWAVAPNDNGSQIAGVFTHEFGHAINLSHTQVNGQLAYLSSALNKLYPGVPGCGVNPIAGGNPAMIETMYPFIDHYKAGSVNQSTIEHPDDVAAISNLYPSVNYASSSGTISGVLRLKDGRTEYSGINVVARNINNPLFDAISDMSGSATQGMLGPDGRFTIRNLTPGEQYVLYIEPIVAGGFPTTPQPLLSTAEYWNNSESSDPLLDDVCDITPIKAEAGITKEADFTLNGYMKGIQVTPLSSVVLSDMSKNGRKAVGTSGVKAITWDVDNGFEILPSRYVGAEAFLSRNGKHVLLQHDQDGNGIMEPTVWSDKQDLSTGYLGDSQCGASTSIAGLKISALGSAMDDAGATVAGLAYRDLNGNGNCQEYFSGEMTPFIWDEKGGIRELDTSSVKWSRTLYAYAHGLSGNGKVALGQVNYDQAVAWIAEGPMLNLTSAFKAKQAKVSNFDGSRVALTSDFGVKLWDSRKGLVEDAITNIGSLPWCQDIQYIFYSWNLCEELTPEEITASYGAVPMTVSDLSDDGSVAIGRAGGSRFGYYGALWVEDIGWLELSRFLREQGAVELGKLPMSNPIALSGNGNKMIGVAGGMSWYMDMSQVYVCDNGSSVLTGFPGGLREAVANGAQIGRCEMI
ncbi:hypothetical protein [Shewanella acanthi]|uniref:hypothetical protein n=1 Tax=Shewanella acanthi TaxID=2864212 RepID=UPI001C6607C0|nr:hypothetical protein [Shewanella acanthi]QYJ79704.1 hypothetical protein K0H61_04515 [Shewanella acanthi]